MNNVGEKFLPIGTVVMLKGASKRLMITGFCSMPSEDEGEMFDYAGCMYPEGFLSSDQTALFNHNQIERVYHLGLIDDEEKTFKQSLIALVSQMPSGSSELQPVAPEAAVVPPVGPGLPGYVAPAPVEPAVPPVGPGLPGYVAPAPVEPAPIVDGIQFDANGKVIAVPQSKEVPAGGSDENPAAPNFVFDENGVLISA